MKDVNDRKNDDLRQNLELLHEIECARTVKIEMTEAIKTLVAFQVWRRHEGELDGPEMPDVKKVGKAIDYAIELLSAINDGIKTREQNKK